jgi:hypothetical protein
MAGNETPSENEKATYPLRLEKELLEKSKVLADKRGMSLAALIRGFLIRETQDNP